MAHTAKVALQHPLPAVGGPISHLHMRLPARPVADDAGELEVLSALTGLPVSLLEEIDMDDADPIYRAVEELFARAARAGDIPRPTLSIVGGAD